MMMSKMFTAVWIKGKKKRKNAIYILFNEMPSIVATL